MPWGKVYKKNIFSNLRFPEKYWYEDTICRQIIYPIVVKHGATACSVRDCVYNYRSNPKSITHTGLYNPKCIDSYYIVETLHKDCLKLGLPIDEGYYNYLLPMIKLTYSRTKYVPSEIKEAIFVGFRHFLVQNFNGYRTKIEQYEYLEKAIREGNYTMYRYVLSLM